MVGLGSVDNTTDLLKPLSTATIAALAAKADSSSLGFKADKANPIFSGTVSGITPTMVGLGSVNNTTDASKPVSTLQQAALNLKADLASAPTFTGTVTTPTISITSGTAVSITSSIGALQVSGGAGISGNVSIGGNIFLKTGSSVYVDGTVLSSGGGGQTTTTIDFTSYSKSNFYAIEIVVKTIAAIVSQGVTIPTEFFITGESLDGSTLGVHNDNTLYGYIRTGGWSDHPDFYEFTQKMFSTTETRFYGIYTGAQHYRNLVFYARGGYNYYVTTNATIGQVAPTNGITDGSGCRFNGAITEAGGLSAVAPGFINNSPANYLLISGYLLSTNSINRTLKSEALEIQNTTVSTSTITGALIVAGGAGFGKEITALSYNASSDSRIKTNITNICGQSSLDLFRNLKPSEYKLIANPEKPKTYGFIAQEIMQTIPEAVILGTDFVPSIYEMAFIDDKTMITLINKTTSKAWQKIKISDKHYDVADIIDDKTFRIKTEINKDKIELVDVSGAKLSLKDGVYKYKDTDEIYTGIVKNGVFVYGPEVPDFHSLNKDMIWTVTTRATQELDKQLQDARQRITTLENQVSELTDLVKTLINKQ